MGEASMASLCCLSFTFTIGMLMVVLGCALFESNYLPLLVIITYVLAPLPTTMAKRASDDGSISGVCGDMSLFFTTFLVFSGYGIPFVLWHNGDIEAGAGWLVASGNTVMYLSILVYFKYFTEDEGYSNF